MTTFQELTICFLGAVSLVGCVATQNSTSDWEAEKIRTEAFQQRQKVVRDSLDKVEERRIKEKTREFVEAAKSGDLNKVKLLMNEGLGVDFPDVNGSTALMAASANGHIEVVNFLLDNGAKQYLQDDFSETALFKASSLGRVQIVEMLLKRGVGSTLSSDDIELAFREATKKGNAEVLRLLEKYKKIQLATEKKVREEQRKAEIKEQAEKKKAEIKEQAERKKAEAAERRRLERLPEYEVQPFGYNSYGTTVMGYVPTVEECWQLIELLHYNMLDVAVTRVRILRLPKNRRVRLVSWQLIGPNGVSYNGVGITVGEITFKDSDGQTKTGYVPRSYMERVY